MGWPFRSWDSKIFCISRMNWWNELIFSCKYKYRKAKSFGKNLVPGIWVKMLLPNQITGQSDYRIFKSSISIEQNEEKTWFFACWYRFMGNRSWLKNIGVDMVKNGCGHSVLRTLKLAVCQGKINEINWFLLCWYKFMKAKSYFNNF